MNKNLEAGLGFLLGLGAVFAIYGVFWVASKAWNAGSKNADGK